VRVSAHSTWLEAASTMCITPKPGMSLFHLINLKVRLKMPYLSPKRYHA
jgi:hypothetical protein